MSERDRLKPGQLDQERGPAEAAGSHDGPVHFLIDRFGAAGAQRIIQRKMAERRAARLEQESAAQVQAAAEKGTSSAGGPLPHLDTIQKSFGRHDVSHVKAHVDGAAAAGAQAMGAEAFATGDHVAFAGAPSLHTAAHEAAHVIQQRGGVQLKGGLGETDDRHERQADQVADRVVQGQSAEALLDPLGAGRASSPATIQRKIKEFAGEQEKRIEVILPDTKSIHLEVDRGDTVAELKQYMAGRLGCEARALLVSEYVGVDEPVGDQERLVPHLIYKVSAKKSTRSLREDANAEKLVFARKIDAAVVASGYDVFLGGGGAAAVLGSGRDIKDLDYKMGAGFKEAYKKDPDSVVQKLREAVAAQQLKSEVQLANKFVFRVLVRDARADEDTQPIEVSFTTTGSYNPALARASEETEGVTLVGEMELLLDKLFAFCERSTSEMEKLETDFIDVVTLIDLNPALEVPAYIEERLAGYLKKFRREQGTVKTADPRIVNAYNKLAPDIGLQVAMRTSLILSDSTLREQIGLRKLRDWIGKAGNVAKSLQELSKRVER
jgi:hypothetical protein